MSKPFFASVILLLFLVGFSHSPPIPSPINLTLPTSTPSPPITPTLTPTPPLTFSQINALYGPCTVLPVLMYHHVQSEFQASQLQQTGLSVYTPIFRTHMEYLKNHGYSVISASSLLGFLNQHTPLPSRPILLTFDDGYADFYTDALPILKEFNYPSIIFISTGLMDNPNYLTWEQISILPSHQVYVGNHTWSHYNVGSANSATIQTEISTADTQITDHGFPRPQIIAYPYGSYNTSTQTYLSQTGYQIGFTTQPGNIVCSRLRFNYPDFGQTTYLYQN